MRASQGRQTDETSEQAQLFENPRRRRDRHQRFAAQPHLGRQQRRRATQGMTDHRTQRRQLASGLQQGMGEQHHVRLPARRAAMGRRIEGIHRITRADQLLDQMGELCRPAGPAMQQQDCRPLAPAQHRQPEAQSDALRTGQQRQLPILRRPLSRHHERPTHTLGRPTRRDAADRPVETANPGQAAHLAPPQFTACLAARRTRSDSSPAPMPGPAPNRQSSTPGRPGRRRFPRDFPPGWRP